METSNLHIENIQQKDDRTLEIAWTNGTTHLFDAVELRKKCPCAACIDEWTRKPLLKPDSVADTTRPTTIKSVGRYAISIGFNDNHNTGIYPYDYLFKIGSGVSV